MDRRDFIKKTGLIGLGGVCIFLFLIFGVSSFPVNAIQPNSLISLFTYISAVPKIDHISLFNLSMNYTIIEFNSTSEIINPYSSAVRVTTPTTLLANIYAEYDFENGEYDTLSPLFAGGDMITKHTIPSGITEENQTISFMLSPGHVDSLPFGNYTFWIDGDYYTFNKVESLFFSYASSLIVNETGITVYLGGADQSFEPSFRINSGFMVGVVSFTTILCALIIRRKISLP